MSSTEELQSIIDLIKRNPEQGFIQLNAAYGSVLKEVARAELGNTAWEEDAVQDFFIKLYLCLKKNQGHQISHPKGYLHESVRNSAMDILRRFSVNQPIVAHAMHAHSAGADTASTDTIEIIVERRAITSELYELVKKLPRAQSYVIRLRIEGFSEKEIAEKLKLPLNTVKSHVHRARRTLQRQRDAWLC